MEQNLPFLIKFPKIGNDTIGYISYSEKELLPFIPKRIYWTYKTSEQFERGNHSHYELEQILVALTGKIVLNIITLTGEEFEYILDTPDVGVFIPKQCWRKIKYFDDAVQMCIASLEYSESDYIRDYKEFEKLINKKD